MKITQTTPTKLGGHENKTGSAQASGSYKIGQVLEARVLTNSSHGQVNLRLGSVEIIAATKIGLQQNAHLSLKVVQLQPQLLLQVIASSAKNPLQEAKINMLPRQTSLAPLLAELVYKIQAKETTANQPSLRTTGNQLIAAISDRNDIKRPDGLQHAIRQSGLFLETKLTNIAGNNPADLTTDLKALLLRYLNALSQTQKDSTFTEHAPIQAGVKPQSSEILPPLKGRLPTRHPLAVFSKPTTGQDIDLASPDILKKIQGALARLGLLQVASAENFDDGQVLWQLEIPVRQGNTIETVSLTIKKEQGNPTQEEQESAAWTVNLSLDLPRLGSLQSRVTMDNQGISTTFWSDSTKTLSVIESRLSELRASFEQQGLKAHNLSCRTGQQQTAESTQADSHLIDYQV